MTRASQLPLVLETKQKPVAFPTRVADKLANAVADLLLQVGERRAQKPQEPDDGNHENHR